MDALDILDIALLRRLDEPGLEKQIFFCLDAQDDDNAFICQALLAQMQHDGMIDGELVQEPLFVDVPDFDEFLASVSQDTELNYPQDGQDGQDNDDYPISLAKPHRYH